MRIGCHYFATIFYATMLTMLPCVATMMTMLPVSSQCCHYANCDVVPALVSTQLSPAAGQPSQPSTGVPASGRGDQHQHGDTCKHCHGPSHGAQKNSVFCFVCDIY